MKLNQYKRQALIKELIKIRLKEENRRIHFTYRDGRILSLQRIDASRGGLRHDVDVGDQVPSPQRHGPHPHRRAARRTHLRGREPARISIPDSDNILFLCC